MINKNLDQITEQDLQELIDNAVIERKKLEYKQELPGKKDSDKIKFLAAVSSFANASGGNIIYGISENRGTGAPESLDGLTIQNVDQEIARLENMIRNGIAPRITSITIRPIPLSNAKTALIIRILRSWNLPHRVILKGHDKFYSRNSNGKYPLDVGELRVMFTLSETVAEKIRKFREIRLSSIRANETFVPIPDTPKIVLHLIPFNSFALGQRYDASIDMLRSYLWPINCPRGNFRYNLDGFLTYCGSEQTKLYNYAQFFRSGIIEAVEGFLLGFWDEKRTIPGITYEEELIKSLKNYLSLIKELNIEPPVVLFLSLLEVKGYTIEGIGTSYSFLGRERNVIDRDVLLIQEILIEDYDEPADKTLRDCFDSVWNACGFSQCPNYDEEGNWVGKRR